MLLGDDAPTFHVQHMRYCILKAICRSKGETTLKRKGNCMQWLLCPPAHHNKVLPLCPGFTSLQAKHSHALIPALKFMKITSVIFSQCLPACYIYLYITTLLNQFKVGRSHDYIEVGRRGGRGGTKRGERGRGKKNRCHSVIAYYSVILCIDIDNTYVYICRD